MKRGEWVRCYGGPTVLRRPAGESLVMRCFRCNESVAIACPISLQVLPGFLRVFAEAHDECPQTLLGARYELTLTLHGRKWDLEHPGKE